VRNLFPSGFDKEPFYCGFGNRPTDAESYEANGIPKDRIFIINPKSVIVNMGKDRVEGKVKTSYKALMEKDTFDCVFPSVVQRDPRFIKDGGQERISPGPKLNLANILSQPGSKSPLL
jgi:phosphatidate phosphatase PAH1